jgi:ribonuclease HI
MWQTKDSALYQEFTFKDFKQAFGFMQEVAVEAEKQQHHPRWENEWNMVKIWLSTHDAGQVTDKDQALAEAIDRIFENTKLEKVADKKTTPVTEVKLYTDGGSRGNPGPAASGFGVLDMHDKVIIKRGIYLGITTNNQAEYRALQFGLEEALKLGAHNVDVYMDSQLIVNQMLGLYKVKHQDLQPIHETVKALLLKFKHVSFTHIPRELNKLADSMVNEALDKELLG